MVKTLEKIFTLKRSVLGLRIALGITFLWFGALKLSGYNPVFDIIYAGFPILAEGIGFIALGLFEAVIGVGLLFNIFPIVVDVALILHLLGTLTVFVTGSNILFDPHFPFLTLAGEFVFKNIILLMAGFVVLRYKEHAAKQKE